MGERSTYMLSAIERMRVMCMIALVYIRVNINCTTENTSAAPVTRSSKKAVCLGSFTKGIIRQKNASDGANKIE